MSRIILLQQDDPHYRVTESFFRQLRDGFEALGYTAELRAPYAETVDDFLYHIAESRPEAVIAMSYLPPTPEVNGLLPWDLFEVPAVVLLVDHPCNQTVANRYAIGKEVGWRLFGCVDRTHVQELPIHYGADKYAFFLPHGGLLQDPLPQVDGDRPIDVLFTGTYVDPAALREMWPHLAYPIPRMLQEMSDSALKTHTLPFLEVLEPAFRKRGFQYGEKFRYLGASLMVEWDHYLRNVRRNQVIHLLEEEGIAADIYGKYWSRYRGLNGHRLHGQIPFDQVAALCAQAKVVLNVGPNFPQGSHERVLTAMLAGAAVVTDETTYWKDVFVDGEDIALYRFDAVERVPELVRSLLLDREKRCAMARSGQEKALAGHTWKQRAEVIAKEVRAFRSKAPQLDS